MSTNIPSPHLSSIHNSSNEGENEQDKQHQILLQQMTLQNHSKNHKIQEAILGDGSFENMLKERTKSRKEKEDLSMAELRVSMSNMERSLAQETKRRMELTSQLESTYQEKILQMEHRLNSIIDTRINTIMDRVHSLEGQIHQLNLRLEEEKTKIPQDIERIGKALQEEIQRLQQEFQMERKDRLQRESRIVQQVTDHSEIMKQRWDEERMDREKMIQQLTQLIQENLHPLEDLSRGQDLIPNRLGNTTIPWNNSIAYEIGELYEELNNERNIRKMEDESIVQALYQYTEKLEKSLSIISGDED